MDSVTIAGSAGGTVGVEASELRGLEARLAGTLVTPEHPFYESVRRVWNGLVDKRPALIARCATAEDVARMVDFARERGLQLAIRGGGHNVAGRAVNEGGLVIDLSLMRGVEVDAAARVARVQGGARLGDVDAQTQAWGLAAPLGLVSATGIAGYTLHGGYGWLTRRCGLAVDSLVGAEVVAADGRRLRADARENPDLFWALRGGGGNFGVVTSFEFALQAIGHTVWSTAVFYPLDEAPTVLRAYREYLAEAPEELGALATLWTSGAEAPFPAGARGVPVVAVAATWTGPLERGDAITRPLRTLGRPLLDLSGPKPYLELQRFFDADYPDGRQYYWKSLYLPQLEDEVLDLLAERGRQRPSPYTSLDLWAGSGAAMRVAPEATAFARRGSPWMVALESSWDDPAQSARNVDWTREVHRELERFSGGETYLNFPGFAEEGEELVHKAYGANYERLRAIKRQYDPNNLFRGNFNIAP